MLFRRIAIEIMNSRASLFLVVPLLVLACDKDKRKKPSTADTAPTHDTGPEPDSDPDCDTGYLNDDGECVPAACGTGTWGNLEVEESTVYVDIMAAEGGDGSEAAPFTSIQAGLDAAGDANGGMVAVAAGTYPETLELDRGHDGVHLAGRCRELVIIDASVGDETTPGIDVDAKTKEVEVSGVTVNGSFYVGVRVGSGTMTIRDSAVSESEYIGIAAYNSGLQATALAMNACEVAENTTMGVIAFGSGTSVAIRETIIEDTKPDENGEGGLGIDVSDGANLVAEACAVRGNTLVGLNTYCSGTSVTLRETAIEDTKPGESGKYVVGIHVSEGASLDTERCVVKGNTGTGVFAHDSGTSVTLRETAIEDTQSEEDQASGFGIYVYDGASLVAEGCAVRRNTCAGMLAINSGTTVTLQETTIEETQPAEYGEGGYGIQASNGASLLAEACTVTGNTSTGVLVVDSGTSVNLKDTRIAATMRGEIATVGTGVTVGYSASVVATAVEMISNEGPGIYAAGEDALLNCSDCLVQDNQFAGAVVVGGASLQFADSLIEGTTEQENLGGGVGIFADPWLAGPPTLSVTDSTIQDNAIAGVWLSGEGSYSLSGNTIHGGEGWTRESLTKCGDAVFARDGVTTWDGSSGLLLENNELLNGTGAGLFLDDATATLSGNSYSDNAVDIVTQGGDCETPPDGYEGEAFSSDAELCPAYDYATCGDEFRLYLELAKPESGHGAALMNPGLPGPGALPTLPAALPLALDPLPLLPPAPRLAPLEFRRQPVRLEPAPLVPFVVARER